MASEETKSTSPAKPSSTTLLTVGDLLGAEYSAFLASSASSSSSSSDSGSDTAATFDCELVVDSKTGGEPPAARLFAHAVVLSLFSPVFRRLLPALRASAIKSGLLVTAVPLSDSVTGVGARALLDFFYLGKVDSDQVSTLAGLAALYEVAALSTLVSRQLVADITQENALALHGIAPRLGLGAAVDFAIPFIAKHATHLFQTDAFLSLPVDRIQVLLRTDALEIDEMGVFNAVYAWGQAEAKRTERKDDPETLKSILAPLLPLVRFPLLRTDDLALIATKNLLSAEQMMPLFTYSALKSSGTRLSFEVGVFSTTPRLGPGATPDGLVGRDWILSMGSRLLHASVGRITLRSGKPGSSVRSHLWRACSGLFDAPGAVSFESLETPGTFLRHAGFVLHQHGRETNELYRQDSTFHPVSSGHGHSGLVLQSTNFRDRFLRGRHDGDGSDVVIDADNSTTDTNRTAWTFTRV